MFKTFILKNFLITKVVFKVMIHFNHLVIVKTTLPLLVLILHLIFLTIMTILKVLNKMIINLYLDSSDKKLNL